MLVAELSLNGCIRFINLSANATIFRALISGEP